MSGTSYPGFDWAFAVPKRVGDKLVFEECPENWFDIDSIDAEQKYLKLRPSITLYDALAIACGSPEAVTSNFTIGATYRSRPIRKFAKTGTNSTVSMGLSWSNLGGFSTFPRRAPSQPSLAIDPKDTIVDVEFELSFNGSTDSQGGSDNGDTEAHDTEVNDEFADEFSGSQDEAHSSQTRSPSLPSSFANKQAEIETYRPDMGSSFASLSSDTSFSSKHTGSPATSPPTTQETNRKAESPLVLPTSSPSSPVLVDEDFDGDIESIASPIKVGKRKALRPPARPAKKARINSAPSNPRPPSRYTSAKRAISRRARKTKAPISNSSLEPSDCVSGSNASSSILPNTSKTDFSTLSFPPGTKRFPCVHDGCAQVCTSLGDLKRHLESLAHKKASHQCLGCRESYTRVDALKRHHANKPACKRDHQKALNGA